MLSDSMFSCYPSAHVIISYVILCYPILPMFPYVIPPYPSKTVSRSRNDEGMYPFAHQRFRLLDTPPSLMKSAIVKAPPLEGKGFSQYEAVFLQLADEHRTVNAFELQELLEACLPNGETRDAFLRHKIRSRSRVESSARPKWPTVSI